MKPALTVILMLLLTPTTNAVARADDSPVDYARDIKPIFKARCYACHGALKQKSGLRLDTVPLMRTGGEGGPALVAGNLDESQIVERIEAGLSSGRMPPEGAALKPEEIARVKSWIVAGAPSPSNEPPEEDPRNHWAFRMPIRPRPPNVHAPSANGNPIDAFVSAELQRKGLAARPAAAGHVRLRRLYLDLIGVPPTRNELLAFLADPSPSAWNSVVDRLLSDPRHGERWGRHWMDVWRYSDWYGRRHVPDVWNSAPQIWRWRDWIVQSLNADHGYDQMLREMLASDEIRPEDDQAVVATGYLVRNWYALNPNDWMRSIVEHTGKAFLGLTFNCAHCHDHKYDPIAQTDYFRLRAFFEPIHVRQDRVPGEADPGPFQDYAYSVLRKIQRLGLVRVFDKTPDAPTWFYLGGDERNRVKDRDPIAPGLPAFLSASQPIIQAIELPPRAWYPGLRPEIQRTVLADARATITTAESELTAVKKTSGQITPALVDQLKKAQSAFDTAASEAERAGRPGALSGRQSLLLDAAAGRRILQNRLEKFKLKTLNDGSMLRFQLLIHTDTHVNFQLVKDVVKGLTDSCVAFEKGRIVAYRPGSFDEFEAGRYDFAGGQRRFEVSLVLRTKEDRCLLTVRSLSDGKMLIENAPVALNGWNPVVDKTKAISFDARAGSMAVIDDVTMDSTDAPVSAGEGPAARPTQPTARFDFEPPSYVPGRDAVGVDGWMASPFGTTPASSIVSAAAANYPLFELERKLWTARLAVDAPALRIRAAEAKLVAARAELESVEARITADRARYGESRGADSVALARAANTAERQATCKKAEADLMASEQLLALASGKPTNEAGRAKALDDASKQVDSSRAALDKARAAAADPALKDTYSPFSPTYPKVSTGRRRALAEWITSSGNPLTARVAVNHIWARHFHAPLVASVQDFGRNGARPSHPELLDWLAVELMKSGWSMKHIHRLIVTSAAWQRMSSMGDGAHDAKIDPENQFLWRMNTGRMEAEVVRDSLLSRGGMLDPTMGGQELENSQALTTHRRSLYYSVFPEDGGHSELGGLFDAPNPLECYRRTRTILPQQALALTNSDLVHQLSTRIVSDWIKPLKVSSGAEWESKKERQFVIAMFEQILSRPPSEAEQLVCRQALAKQRELLAKSMSPDPDVRAWESLVRALLNHNDFITIR